MLAGLDTKVEKFIVGAMKPVQTQPLLGLFVSWILIVSIVLAINDLPHSVKNFMTFKSVRGLLLFISVFLATENVVVSAGVTVGVMIIFYGLLAAENFALIWPETDVHPGCTSITKQDLLSLFEGDEAKLKRAMYEGGVPLDTVLNDSNAPLISTYLVNLGHRITASCRPPF